MTRNKQTSSINSGIDEAYDAGFNDALNKVSTALLKIKPDANKPDQFKTGFDVARLIAVGTCVTIGEDT